MLEDEYHRETFVIIIERQCVVLQLVASHDCSSYALGDHEAGAHLHRTPSFLRFPYVCPEPVLVK